MTEKFAEGNVEMWEARQHVRIIACEMIQETAEGSIENAIPLSPRMVRVFFEDFRA